MSLLFDKDKVFVDVLSTKLTDTEATPIRDGVMHGIIRNSGVAHGITAGVVNGLGTRAKRYYKYGEEDKFIDGLPDAGIGKEPNNPNYTSTYTEFPGGFYPICNLRRDKVYINEDEESERYISSRNLLRRVALHPRNIIETITGDRPDEAGSNPSNDLDDIFYLFGLDIFSMFEESALYMANFWEMVAGISEFDQGEFEFNKDNMVGPSGTYTGLPTNSIKLGELDGEFDIKITYDYITIEDVSGTLHDDEGNELKAVMRTEKGPQETIDTDLGDGGTGLYSAHIDGSFLEIKKQLDGGKIKVIKVVGLAHQTMVKAYDETNGVIRTLVELIDDYAGLGPEDENFGRSGFYIPLHKDTVEMVTLVNQEKVLTDAMMVVMHSAVEVELKWYQQGWFKIVMIVIVAVVLYFTLGSVNLGAMTFSQFATFIGQSFAISYLINLLVAQVDGTLGLILAAALAAYAITRGDVSKINNLLPYAGELLQATQIVATVGGAELNKQQRELESDYDALETLQDIAKDELEEINKLLQVGDDTDSLDYLWLDTPDYGPNPLRDELPDSLYKRAGTTNVAETVYDAIPNYVNNMLKLPEELIDQPIRETA